MILFISNKEDITTDIVINRINKMELPYYRLNTETIIDEVGVNFDITNNSFFLIDHKKNIKINLNDIKSVYYRRPKIPDSENTSLSESERIFVKNEIAYTLEGLYKILQDKFWISPVYSIREAENKIYQLVLARKIGFKTPFSLVTSIEENAKEFIDYNEGDCIIKPIKSGLIGTDNKGSIVFTSLLDDGQRNSLKRVTKHPTYFQKRIHKQYDIRVTVVGSKIFSAKIHSQEYKETQIDWRKGSNPSLKYEAFELDSDTSDKCLRLVKFLNLNYGAIDFVEQDDGELIFLEINPNGQWGWIEKKLNYDISGEIIKILGKGMVD